ncbi:NAD-dependent succinate-semialdehyde dehydrogenase, partial [Actibacterium sp.]|uniref:NAD-dependent succinate-semialdehyde dehydrogenase n=1 Tax=Actibacterium sp. TaxID=1872125 RepID=UPI0035637A37
MTQYPEIRLHLGGTWWGDSDRHVPVINPATGQPIGQVPVAGAEQLQQAAGFAQQGFAIWRATGAHDRAAILRKTAQLLRDRADALAHALTLEQGRPLGDTKMECMIGAEVLDWFAEEAKRTYGRIIPARQPGVSQLVEKQPIGPVLAISTWNVPINHAARKLGAALAAGCSVVLKGPEEAPASTMMVVQAFLDAGLPAPVLSLVFGDPAQISDTLIAHPVIRKLTFTGSTPIGKLLASKAGAVMKPATLELGGHAPVLIFDDADIDKAVAILSMTKFRNAGQICISPTRFLVQDGVFDRFTDGFTKAAEAIKTGNGLDPDSQMGPLSTQRRVEAVEALVQDALSKGATLRTGGTRIGNEGFFYAPTVLTDVPTDAVAMNDEPFGPVALINRFSTYDQAMSEANRLDYGLAAYAYTGTAQTANRLAADIESGMLSINHHGLGPVEAPFGGVKGSGMGSEGGPEAV